MSIVIWESGELSRLSTTLGNKGFQR